MRLHDTKMDRFTALVAVIGLFLRSKGVSRGTSAVSLNNTVVSVLERIVYFLASSIPTKASI